MGKVLVEDEEKEQIIANFRSKYGKDSYGTRIALCSLGIICGLVGTIVPFWYFLNSAIKDQEKYEDIEKLRNLVGNFTKENLADMQSLNEGIHLKVIGGLLIGSILFAIAVSSLFILFSNILRYKISHNSNDNISVYKIGKVDGNHNKYHLKNNSIISKLINGCLITCNSEEVQK